jgi:plastocyanin
MGTAASLFATLLLIPLSAAAKTIDEVAATGPTVPSSSSQSTGAAPVWIVKMSDDEPMYQPATVHVRVGQTVEWQNDGQVSHSVTDDPSRANKPVDALLPAGVKPFNSGNVMPGGRYRYTFTQPGRYRYFCLTHEMDQMIGEVIVEPQSGPPSPRIVRSERPAATRFSAPLGVPPVAGPAGVRIVRMNDDDPMYRPSSIQISAGDSVEWQNDGQVSHSVTDDRERAQKPEDALLPLGATPFNSGNIMPGGKFRFAFRTPGRYRYFCLTHEGDRMVGEVIVTPSVRPRKEQLAGSMPPPPLADKPSRERPPRVVKIRDEEPNYLPKSIEIVSGQTVEWKNEGRAPYSVTNDPVRAGDPLDATRPQGASPFSSGNILPGGRFRHTFTEPGRYRYFCPTHGAGKMIGEVIVEPAGKPETSANDQAAEDISVARSAMAE